MGQQLLRENNLIPFETNKLYEFWLNSEYNLLPAKVIESMIKAVITEYQVRKTNLSKQFPYYSFANEITWAPMHEGGALVKRIAKWLKDNLGFKASDDLRTGLGSLMRKATLPDQTFFFDIVTEFKWPRGNFGDHSSCFLSGGDRGDIPAAMEKEGNFGAIRFFKRNPNRIHHYDNSAAENRYYADNDYYYQGFSRAFLRFDEARGTISHYKQFTTTKKFPMVIVFNGYGYNTEQIGAIVASFLGHASRKIKLTNNNSTSGGLYVNADGILIGDASVIQTVNSYDFGMKWGRENPPMKKGFDNDHHKEDQEIKAKLIRQRTLNDAHIGKLLNGLQRKVGEAITEIKKKAPREWVTDINAEQRLAEFRDRWARIEHEMIFGDEMERLNRIPQPAIPAHA